MIITDITEFFIKNAFYTLAIILVISKLFKTLFHSKNFLYPLLSMNADLSARYGKDSWAVITGSSDGIGKAFAFELAKRGFNIVLMGLNREKLENVEKELKSQSPSVQTKIIVEDFKNASSEEYSQRILDQVRGLDVSFLVNNAAISITKNMIDIPVSDVRDIVMINALAPALLTRAFLPTLSRRKRSALITVSSIMSDYSKTRSHLYGATKAFIDFLTHGLRDEHKNIDFLTLKPASVATKMSGREASGTVISPESCVKSALKALGHTDSTYGNWKHSAQASFLRILPAFLRKKIF